MHSRLWIVRLATPDVPSNTDPDHLTEARRLQSVAVVQNGAGHPTTAIRTLRRALALLPGDGRPEVDAVATRIWISMATSESELNGLAAGLAALERAGPHLERSGEPELRFLFESQLGFMKYRSGFMDEALTHLDTALALDVIVEPALRRRILLNRGTVNLYRGDLRTARQDLSAAARRPSGEPVDQVAFMAQHNLGYVEFLAGNLATSLQILDGVRQSATIVSSGVMLLDRARVLLEAGLHREADETLDEAGELFRRDRLWKDVGEVELARAECALLDGEIDAARRLAGSARTRFRRRRNDRWRRDAELVLLQADLAADRPGLRLAPHALRLANEFAADRLFAKARTARLLAAECYLAADRPELAYAAAAEAEGIRPSDPIATRLHARYVRAQLAVTEGHGPTARREIRRGLKELARYQAQFGGIDLQTASAIHGRKLAELNLQTALTTGRPEQVLAAVERGRAISNRLTSVSAPTDETAAQLLAELRQLSEELRTVESDPAAHQAVGAKRKRVHEIQKALRARSWQFEGAGVASEPARAHDIGEALEGAGATLVCYFEIGDSLHAVVSGTDTARLVSLGATEPVFEQIKRVRADLDVLANGILSGSMLRAVAGSLARSLSRLDDALLKPLGLPDTRLVLVPTGLLATLPWTILPSALARPVVVAPSATAWLSATRAPATRGGDVVALAGPDLARSDEEATTIGKQWRTARVFTGAGSTRDRLAEAMTTARIVHVAAHGEHQMDNPLFSSIRLADAPLYAYELDQHAQAAEHVILSACELGQATIRPGDEALGLTSVLLHLGTRSVVSGVARVHDDVAAEVMSRYHRSLAKGFDSAQALAEACAAEQELPAPFVCFGSAWRAS